MSGELGKQIVRLFGEVERPRAVYNKRSYIIASEEGKQPRLERCRIFVPVDESGYERLAASIVVTTLRDEKMIRDILQNKYGMQKNPKGKEDPSWLVEVWA